MPPTPPRRPAEVPLADVALGLAQLAREAWEPLWPLWRAVSGCPEGASVSHQTCVATSIALQVALQRVVPEYRWTVVGGRPTKKTPRGGYRDQVGKANPHLWVEGRCRGSTVLVADVTADQFGGPPVLVSPDRSRYTGNATKSVLERYRLHEHDTVELYLEALDAYIRLQPSA